MNSISDLKRLYVVVSLSFLRSNQSCFIVIFLFSAHQIFYRSHVYEQHFHLGFLASLYLLLFTFYLLVFLVHTESYGLSVPPSFDLRQFEGKIRRLVRELCGDTSNG